MTDGLRLNLVTPLTVDQLKQLLKREIRACDCKVCGGEGHLFCWDDAHPEIGQETYAVHCEDCDNEGPIKPSASKAVEAWNQQNASDATPLLDDRPMPYGDLYHVGKMGWVFVTIFVLIIIGFIAAIFR